MLAALSSRAPQNQSWRCLLNGRRDSIPPTAPPTPAAPHEAGPQYFGTIQEARRSTTGRVGPTPSLSLKPGARLVREWHGRTHTVTVTEDGFEYAGASYPSLTKIAKKITGAHWSGPRFFGLPAAGNGASEQWGA